MANLTTTKTGRYDLALVSKLITGVFEFDLSGTTWDESIAGNKYLLVCSTNDGQAFDELCKLKVAANGILIPINLYESALGSQASPAITWLFNSLTNNIYKVLNVIDDNTIEVEYHENTGSAIQLAGVYTRGSASCAYSWYPPVGGGACQLFQYSNGINNATAAEFKNASSMPLNQYINLNDSIAIFVGNGSLVLQQDNSRDRRS